MYLVTRPQPQADSLIKFLAINQIKARELLIMAIEYNKLDLTAIIQNINAAGSLLLVSPTTIQCFGPMLSQIDKKVKLITVGAGSAQLVADYYSHQILCPSSGSGVTAIIHDKLLVGCDKLVILGGDEINLQLADHLEKANIDYQFIPLYQRINAGLMDIVGTEKIICNPANIGIIITSSGIARYLLECSDKSSAIANQLPELQLISIHPQITQILLQHDLKWITETAGTDNQAILTVIRKLENE